MDFNGGSEKADHLCVLVHGLWGNPGHLKQVAKALRDRHPEDKLHILLAKSNAGYNTYDGIETGGERVCAEIEKELASIESRRAAGKKSADGDGNGEKQIKKLSIVGYSLGGLVARYAVGLLYAKGALENLECMNFTAFASPFLGVRSPLKGWANKAWNVLGARVLTTSGHQLFGIDSYRDTGRPLIAVLADPSSIFMAGLRKFRRRTLYCNVVNDRSAVFYTTSISKTDPFADIDSVKPNYVPGYEDVVMDRTNPYEQPRASSAAASSAEPPSVGDRASRYMKRVPLMVAFTVIIPFGIIFLLGTSAWQSVSSARRRQLHERGLAGVDVAPYRALPPLLKDIQHAIEGTYEEINAAHDDQFLDANTEDDDDDDDDDDDSAVASSSSDENAAPTRPAAKLTRQQSIRNDKRIMSRERRLSTARREPTLALAPYQFEAVDNLDKLGWRKYPVYIKKVNHTHAAIIVRMDKPSFSEGWLVLEHWVKEEFLI